ncbi:MAG: hydroxymethylglutaryl-CoA synthase [Thermoplasmata archaeon]|jgi:uncharacterized OB-fold protein|nr:hydroxymethylglutaryl-CoA synthase [Thermoplasmata archaeon]
MRQIVDAARAQGSLAVDPKSEGAEGWGERALAWDEDLTTLAIAAASAVRHHDAKLVLASPKLDAETIRVALDIKAPVRSVADPMSAAADHDVPTLLLGGQEAWAVACLVEGPKGAVEQGGSPKDVGPAPRVVSAARALAESRRVPPAEPIPDVPMGAYVPAGTWTEDLPARLRLIAQRCVACGKTLYPPRGACPACRGRAFTEMALPREAELYAATRIGRGGAPSEFALEQAQTGAYWVAVVDWPGVGVRLTARLADVDERAPAIGAKLVPVVRRLFDQEGKTRYGLKFRAA